MEEQRKIRAVQVEMPRIQGVRRAGIKILINEEELITITYVPDGSLVIIMDGQTTASGLGLITEVESLGETMANKINAYLGLKHMKLSVDTLKTLLVMLYDFNDGKTDITTDHEIKSKGSRAKRVYTIDLGRAVLNIDTEQILTLDDGFGNEAKFDMTNCVKVEPNPELTGDSKKDKDKEHFLTTCSNEELESRFKPFDTDLNLRNYTIERLLTSARELTIAQAINLAELNLAEEKKRIREEEKANKEPKGAGKKDVLMLMIHSLIEDTKDHKPEVYERLSLDTYNMNYADYIAEVVEPIYRLSQRKSVIDYLGERISDPNSIEFMDTYEPVLCEIIWAFDPKAENVMTEEMKKLDIFSSKSEDGK